MNELKFAVLKQLNKGKSKAITGSLIANRLGMRNDRSIRLAIRELIRDGIPIASSVKPPLGFFIAETKEEAEDYMSVLKGRLIEDALRRRDIKRATQKIRVPEQLVLIK